MIILFVERLYLPFEFGNLSGYLLDVQNVAVTRHVKDTEYTVSSVSYPSLWSLTSAPNTTSAFFAYTTCQDKVMVTSVDSPEGIGIEMVSVDNIPMYRTKRRIPKFVHQTAKSRCVTPAFAEITNQWKLPGYGYYFHDDEAVNRLFQMNFPDFPHLKNILRNCVKNPTLKADLWRYLILWVYGGVYADFDSAPAKFNELSIDESVDEAYFVVEQYHILSQWFMAVSPHHPIMYYAIQYTLENLMEASDTLKLNTAVVSGPHALHRAFMAFRQDAGALVEPISVGAKPVESGVFEGTDGRTIRVVGTAADENEYVQRSAVSPKTKKRDYRTMGMKHFSAFWGENSKESGESCVDAMASEVLAVT